MAKRAAAGFCSAALKSVMDIGTNLHGHAVSSVYLVRGPCGPLPPSSPALFPGTGEGRGRNRCGFRRTGLAFCDAAYFTIGSTLNWWNGGGEDSVHSRVVAPGPQGLFAAFSLRMKATAI